MQLTTIIIAATAAVSTSASVLPRQNSSSFSLSDFYFGGSPHSILQQYTFDVTDGTYSTHCQTTSSITPGLAAFGLTPCNDSCWSFSFLYDNRTNPQPGYILSVTQEITPGTNRTGCRFFGRDQVQLVVDQFNPNGNYYALNAPDAFDLTYTNGPCVFN